MKFIQLKLGSIWLFARRKIDSDLYKSVKFSIFTNIAQYALKCRLNQSERIPRYATIHASSSFVPGSVSVLYGSYMSPIQIRYIPSTGNPEGKTTKDNLKVDHG